MAVPEAKVLSDDDVELFVTEGFLRLEGAFSDELAERCAAELWAAAGVDRDDPATWTSPVIRIKALATPPFVEAANTPRLREAYDELVGEGAWLPRTGLGTFPLRFPHPTPPGDDGWHLEASFADGQGTPRISLDSRGRALLMLFLFSEVGCDDAPTRIRIGSHLLAPPVLHEYGHEGGPWLEVCERAVPLSAGLPETSATGSPGDVYLCHPFLIHAAQPHRGVRPRLMAQPPLYATGPLDLSAASPTPVARAVLSGLGR